MRSVLIANRGEIAVRVARACAQAGLDSVAVYADADADALHVRVATRARALGGTSAAETYLDADKLLAAAAASGADAVHPGYGFLSESAAFARAVEAAGLVWVGPAPETIEALGDKTTARAIARDAGAPLVAGSAGPVAGAEEVLAFAAEHGYPLVLKAAFGGGGRGMRVVRGEEEVADALGAAVREAVAAFGRGEVYVEQYLHAPRHVEAQVLGDGAGRVVVVGTRDCSVQRRHQKLVEEAPAPFLTPEQHRAVVEGARAVCAAVAYRGAGTVEFLVGASGVVSFLEVNTRLQVEHPVTEETSGIDLVRAQLDLARGLPLGLDADPAPRGHAVELRLNAEDPGRGFLPTPGTLGRLDLPGGPGVRVDAGVVAGSVVPADYDSLLAKLVVWGPDRPTALARARQAVDELVVDGVATVAPFHRRLLRDPAFTAPDALGVHTGWVEAECAWLEDLAQARSDPPGAPAVVRTWVEVDGRRVALGLPAGLAASLAAPAGPPGERSEDRDDDRGDDQGGGEGDAGGGAVLAAPFAGTLVRWSAADGQEVAEGSAVAVLEAMKMEQPVLAHRAGRLRRLAEPGAAVAAGAPLARIG